MFRAKALCQACYSNQLRSQTFSSEAEAQKSKPGNKVAAVTWLLLTSERLMRLNDDLEIIQMSTFKPGAVEQKNHLINLRQCNSTRVWFPLEIKTCYVNHSKIIQHGVKCQKNFSFLTDVSIMTERYRPSTVAWSSLGNHYTKCRRTKQSSAYLLMLTDDDVLKIT